MPPLVGTGVAQAPAWNQLQQYINLTSRLQQASALANAATGNDPRPGGVLVAKEGPSDAARLAAPERPMDDPMRGDEQEWAVPSAMPLHLVGTLRAEARRSRAANDAILFAQMLIDAYARARVRNETWGLASGFGKRKKLAALVAIQRAAARVRSNHAFLDESAKRKQLIADALAVALDGATCDKRVLEREQVDGIGVVDIPPSVEMTSNAVRMELVETRLKIAWVTPRKKREAPAMVAPAEEEPPQKASKLLKVRGQQIMVQARLRKVAAAHRSLRVAPEPEA